METENCLGIPSKSTGTAYTFLHDSNQQKMIQPFSNSSNCFLAFCIYLYRRIVAMENTTENRDDKRGDHFRVGPLEERFVRAGPLE